MAKSRKHKLKEFRKSSRKVKTRRKYKKRAKKLTRKHPRRRKKRTMRARGRKVGGGTSEEEEEEEEAAAAALEAAIPEMSYYSVADDDRITILEDAIKKARAMSVNPLLVNRAETRLQEMKKGKELSRDTLYDESENKFSKEDVNTQGKRVHEELEKLKRETSQSIPIYPQIYLGKFTKNIHWLTAKNNFTSTGSRNLSVTHVGYDKQEEKTEAESEQGNYYVLIQQVDNQNKIKNYKYYPYSRDPDPFIDIVNSTKRTISLARVEVDAPATATGALGTYNDYGKKKPEIYDDPDGILVTFFSKFTPININ
jgi:hypothetical protein